MATGELLQAEARERPRMAFLAGGGALFTLAGSLVGRVGSDPPDNLPAGLLYYHEHQATQYVGAVCSVLGVIAITLVLDFLFRATRTRSEATPSWVRPLIVVGGIGMAIFTIAYQISLGINVGRFVTETTQTYEEARAVLTAGVPSFLGLFVQLALAFAIVLVSVNAMRAGLLTRFMGYLGVFSGALFVLAFLPVPIVQAYWLGMLAALFAGRIPSGVPPAWQSGEAMPWPSAAETREMRVRNAEERRGVVAEEVQPSPGPSPATSARKKRKRRS